MKGVLLLALIPVLLLLHPLLAADYSIAYDPTWYPADFKEKTPKINLFIQNYVQSLASPTTKIVLLQSNTQQMLQGLEENRLDGILTTQSPNMESLQRFDFSQPLVDLSLVLIVPSTSSIKKVKQLKGKFVGIFAFDNSVSVVQKYSGLFIREYENMNVALTHLVCGTIDAVVMPRLEAYALVQGLYCKTLKVIPQGLDNRGIYLITRKGSHQDLLQLFNKHL